jgi:hypothetical protein
MYDRMHARSDRDHHGDTTRRHAVQDAVGPRDPDQPERPLAWRKSRYSNPNGACVELAPAVGGDVAMRNSRFPEGTVQTHRADDVRALLDAVKRGEYDDFLID